MLDAAKTPNVVEACNKCGLYDTLEDTQKRYIYHVGSTTFDSVTNDIQITSCD